MKRLGTKRCEKDGKYPHLFFIIKDVCAKSKRKQQKVIKFGRNFSQMGGRPAVQKNLLKKSQNGLAKPDRGRYNNSQKVCFRAG